ncbi:MAG TPA: hypothetical protein VGK63_06590, partial [Candidatus Limnocylindrales bacterium]
MSPAVPIAYLYGDDDFGLDRGAADVAATLETGAGSLGPLEHWRVRGDEIDQAALAERVATAPLFGGGT